MKAIKQYSQNLLRRNAQQVRLDDALISNRAGNYAFYRLRFLFLRTLLKAALHLIELIIIFPLLQEGLLAPIIVVRLATIIIPTLWWGGLEDLRTSVRLSARRNHWQLIRNHMESWISMTSLISTSAIIATIVILYILSPATTISAMDLEAYLFACVFRMSIELIARTYHSGVFAIQRIRRPIWSILLTDFLDVALILVFWASGFLFWSLTFSMFIVGLMRVALLLYFVRRSKKYTRIPPVRLGKLTGAWLALNKKNAFSFIKNAAANLTSQLDTLLIMGLSAWSAATEQGVPLLLSIYLVRPFLSTGYSFARLFYFDFVLIRNKYGLFLHHRFELLLKKTTTVVSVITAVICIIWLQYIVPLVAGAPDETRSYSGLSRTVLFLLPFIAVRAWFGLRQVQAFSYSDFRYLLKLTVVSGTGITACLLLIRNPDIMLPALACVLFVTMWLIPSPKFRPDFDSVHRALSITAFVKKLVNLPQITCFGTARLDTGSISFKQVIAVLLTKNPSLFIARIDRSAFWWASTSPITRAKIVTSCGGALNEIALHGQDTTGENAACLLVGVLNSVVPVAAFSGENKEHLSATFKSRFPNGLQLNISSGALPRHGTVSISPDVIRRILRSISKTGLSGKVKRFDAGAWEVTVFCPGGEPVTLFAVLKNEPVEKRVAWADEVFRASVTASLRNYLKD